MANEKQIDTLIDKLDKVIDLLVVSKKITLPEEDTGKKESYIIKKDPKKHKKTGTPEHPRVYLLSVLIDGVTFTTGDKVDLTPKQLARYGKENFDKYDEKLYIEKDGKYILKPKN